MELGNYICVPKHSEKQVPGAIVALCVADCIRACERYRIEPVGSFEMSYHEDTWNPWNIVRYLFVSDE